MKRRVLAMALAALLAAASFVSCSDVAETKDMVDSSITIVTSDAESYGAWLTDRLDTIPDSVVIGIGDSQVYDVDMSDFENDGYIIKKNSDQVLIFGKTDEGLDKGVRKYANTLDLGDPVTDISYHEGYRIEELRIFGTDISSYVIEYDGAVANENMKFAATELRQLVMKACGAELAINETLTDAPHRIVLRHSDDEALANDGYRYFAEDGALVIEGAVKRGCMYGVYRFLQNECGWEGLSYVTGIRQDVGDSYLNEAALIDIPEDINKTETPAFEYIEIHGNFWTPNAGTTDRTRANDAQFSNGMVIKACHGMQSHMWDNKYHTVHHAQACYTSEDSYDCIIGNICDYIDLQIGAGAIPGETLKCIDISQGDNNRYCFCQSCSEVMAEYGTVSATVIYGANRIAEEINELYPSEEGIAFQIFAYFRSKIPPADMEINEHVYITFAQNGNCSNHPMDGSECDGPPELYDDFLVTDDNVTHAEWLEGWCALSDNVYVWNYALDTVLHQYTVLDVIREDFQYMKEIGVKGLFWQNTYHGFGIKRVEHAIGMELMWDTDMSEAEFEEKLCRLLEREYGDGWAYIREYVDLWVQTTNALGCYNCWGYGSNSNPEYDHATMREYGQTMIELVEKAITLAGDAKQEYRARLFSCHVYYSYIFAHYFTAYENEDTEMLLKLDQMYLDTIDLIEEMGFDITAITSVDGGKVKVYPTLEQEAWLVWAGEREKHVGSDNLRPAPEVEDIYAETTEVLGA